MAQKLIKVKTPMTLDGNMPLMKEGRQVYSESIMTAAARPVLEKRNLSLQEPLRVLIEDYDGPVGVKANEDELPPLPPAAKSAKAVIA